MKHLLTETLLPGSHITFIYVASLISVFFGIYVIISKNPILSVLFLIGLFSSIAVYLITIGLHFIGLSYLLVYIGAISILFLFILMLLNVRISELLTDNKNSILLAVLTVISFNYCISDSLPFAGSIYDLEINYIPSTLKILTNNSSLSEFNSDVSVSVVKLILLTVVATVSSKSWDTLLVEVTHISSLGNLLYTNLFILFIITSLILLLAMVGAIVITISRPLSQVKNVTYENYTINN